MKNLYFTAILAICIQAIGIQAAQAVPIEKDAILSNSVKNDSNLLNIMAMLIRANGYSCSSISGAHPMSFTKGYTVSCNQFRYSYKILDKGGNWVVELR